MADPLTATRPRVRRVVDILWIASIGLVIGAAAMQFWLNREDWILNRFHLLYWEKSSQKNWLGNTRWLNVPVLKYPTDLWVFQEIISATKPDLLIETGTFKGGSAYFFGCIFDLLNHGRVLTIDVTDWPGRPSHPRVQFLLGSSTAPDTVQRVKAAIRPGEKVMVVLDADHRPSSVLKELDLYTPLVTRGNYIVVEDTHEAFLGAGPGPMQAVEAFLARNSAFVADRECEKFLFTRNPRGWLKRVR